MNQNILVRVGADISDLTRKMSQAAGSVKGFSDKAAKIGAGIYGIGKAATKAFTPVYALGAAVGAMGLKRVMDTERVSIMFDTIYDSAKDAEKAMDGVLGLVKGTKYGLTEIADPFAQLKSTGVKDATALQAMLANMNLASMKGDPAMVQRLTELQQAALAMGKFDGTMINRFASAFVDVPTIVGNALGMTRDEARKFLSDGAYDVEEIMNIISDGILNGSKGIAGETKAMGGMIEAEGETLAGKWANMKAAMARAGEKLWNDTGAFDTLKNALDKITDAFDNNADAFVPAVTAIGNAVASLIEFIAKLVDWFQNLSPGVQEFIAKLVVFGAVFAPIIAGVGKFIMFAINLWEALKKLRTIFTVVRIAIAALTGPVGIVIAIISALIAVGIAVWKNWDTIKAKAIEIWGAISAWIMETMGPLVEWLAEKFELAKTVITEIWDGISQYFSGIWDVIKNVFLGALLLILDIFTGDFKSMRSHATQIFGNIEKGLKQAWEGIKKIFNAALKWVVGLVGGDFEKTKATIQRVWNVISSILGDVWAYIKNTFKNALAFVKALVSGDFDGMKKAIVNQMSNIRTNLGSAWEKVKTIFREAGQRILAIAREKFIEIVRAVYNKMNETKNKVQTAWNRARDYLRNIDLKQLGRQIIQGLLNGITGMASSVWRKAQEIANGIKDRIKGALKISSPSRVMAELGRWTGEGLAQGITKMRGMVEKAAEALAEATVFKPSLSYNTPGGLFSSLRGAVSGTVDVKSRDDVLAAAIASLERRLTDLRVEMDRREVGRMVAEPVTRTQNLRRDSGRRSIGIGR